MKKLNDSIIKAYSICMDHSMKNITKAASFPEFMKELENAGFYDNFFDNEGKTAMLQTKNPMDFCHQLMLHISDSFHVVEPIFIKYASEVLEKSKVFKDLDYLIVNRDVTLDEPIWSKTGNEVMIIYTDNKPHKCNCPLDREFRPIIYALGSRENESPLKIYGNAFCYIRNYKNISIYDYIGGLFSNIDDMKLYDHAGGSIIRSTVKSFDYSAPNIINSFCQSFDHSVVTAQKDSSVIAKDYSDVTCIDNAHVALYDASVGTLKDNSSCMAYNNASTILWDKAKCMLLGDNLVVGYDESAIVPCGKNCVIALDDCKITDPGNGHSSNLYILESKSNLVNHSNINPKTEVCDLSRFKSNGQVIEYRDLIRHIRYDIEDHTNVSPLINRNWHKDLSFSPITKHNERIIIAKESEQTLGKKIKETIHKNFKI